MDTVGRASLVPCSSLSPRSLPLPDRAATQAVRARTLGFLRDRLQPRSRVPRAEVALAAIALDLEFRLADLDAAEASQVSAQHRFLIDQVLAKLLLFLDARFARANLIGLFHDFAMLVTERAAAVDTLGCCHSTASSQDAFDLARRSRMQHCHNRLPPLQEQRQRSNLRVLESPRLISTNRKRFIRRQLAVDKGIPHTRRLPPG